MGGGDGIVLVFAGFARSAWVSLHVSGGVARPAFGAAAVSVGATGTCALSGAGAAFCWGWNYFGQLGNSTTANALRPVRVPPWIRPPCPPASATPWR